jgi:hypothetical protein
MSIFNFFGGAGVGPLNSEQIGLVKAHCRFELETTLM